MKRISIDRATLEALYPPMDAAFERQLRQQIDGLPTGKKRSMKKKTGLALVLAAGKLAKCTGTTRPDYIGMFKGTVADGDILPVIRVHEETRFETENSVENAGAVPGARLTIDTTGTMITATTGGAAEISEVIDTAAGGKMIVRFPRVAG